MSVGFGPGLARCLELVGQPADDDQALLAACVQFAEQGLTRRFVEIVGERVAVFSWSPEAGVAVGWLDDSEAAVVHAAASKLRGYTQRDWTNDDWYVILVPDFVGSIPAPPVRSGPLEGEPVVPLVDAIAELRGWHAELDEMTIEERAEAIEPHRLELEKKVLESFEVAEKLGFVFSFEL